MQTRPALVYQGLLLGLFVNGVMRWGFASIIQTPAALGEKGGGQGGGGSWWGATSPNISAVVGGGGGRGDMNISFHWGELPTEKGVDGVSILRGDVERWRGYVDAELNGEREGVTLRRRRRRRERVEGLYVEGGGEEGVEVNDDDDDADRVGERDEEADQIEQRWSEPEFYRFAWMNGNQAGRYGGVGVWDERGIWIPPP